MYLILAAVLVIVGLAGIVIPGVPGPILIFAGLVIAAWTDGFTRVGPFTLVVIGLLTVTTYLIDIAVMTMGMKRLGTTKRAMVGAALGTLAGLFLGLPGLVIGPFVGAVLGELSARRDARAAARAGVLAWVGYLAGTSAKVALAFAMVGIFLAAWFVK
jgi:uncharacterized protein YqgC (DUF456 family)